MDTGVNTITLDIGAYGALFQEIASIETLYRFTMAEKEALPVQTICRIFGWRMPEQGKRPKPELDKAKICGLFRNGKTPKEIAAMAGVEEKAIREVLRAVNLIDQATTI